MPREERTAWESEAMGAAGVELLYETCAKARESIEWEQFIFSTDATGIRFLELFLKKLEAGVKIRLHCDMVGSIYFYSSDWPARLREAGAEVRFFRIISAWRVHNFTGWYLRTHRKLLIVDKRYAGIGGLGIRGDMLAWRDSTFVFRGQIVSQLKETFDTMWNSTEDEVFLRFRRFRDYESGFRVSTNAPHFRQQHLYKNMLGMIRNAKRSIELTTPYFTPNHRFVSALRDAAERGVTVRILLPERSGFSSLDRAAGWYITLLLEAGARIFFYKNGFLHSKAASVDGAWASVGSFNLDGQSFFWNYETNVESVDKDFVAEQVAQFETDLESSREIILSEWLNRPFYQKIIEFLTLPFHRLM